MSRHRAARPKHKKRGLVVFAGILGVILAVSLVSMASIAVYTSLVAAPAAPAEPQAAASSQEQPAASSEPQEWMELQDQPQEQEEVLPDGKLTNQQIIRQVSPSVVAITSYVQSQGYQATGMGSGIILAGGWLYRHQRPCGGGGDGHLGAALGRQDLL